MTEIDPTKPPASPITLRGRLLLDPARPPTVGWLRIEGRRITEMGEGDPPGREPSLGSHRHVISPAFVDAHTHLPQIDSIGCDGMGLLEWLDRVIFPAEVWWGAGAAALLARRAAIAYMNEGSASIVGYLTSHAEPAQRISSMIASETPLRTMLGRVAMDREAPDDLTREDRERVRSSPAPSPLQPVYGDSRRHTVSANPRFAITCTDELLAEIGWRIEEHPGTPVQTHLSESSAECARVAELFPGDETYTHVYDRFGLLTERTLLAHCLHLADVEWRLIADRGSTVVHCPTANTFLQAGIFDLGKARETGVKLALGSDVAAGADVAMPRVARSAIEVAKMRAMCLDPSAHIPTPAEVWELITRRGADAVGWTNSARLEVGADADVLLLRVPDTWHDEHLIGRLIYNWSPDLIEQRVYDGTLWNGADWRSA